MDPLKVIQNRRILVIDDNEVIHHDFQKILHQPEARRCELDKAEEALFASELETPALISYEISTALQGQLGFEKVKEAEAEGRPFALAFVDMRMPPGWDGLLTIKNIWKESPDMQIVICTAYSEYSWDDLIKTLGHTDRFLILKKPFDAVEVRQLACSLTEKWNLSRIARLQKDDLEKLVQRRTAELEAQYENLKREVEWRKQLQQQLFQVQKLEAIGQLAGGIAHDFNNLLTIINGRTGLMLNRVLASDPLHKDLLLVEKTGQKAARLTQQLLAFGRRQMMEPKIINLNSVVAEMDKILRRLIGEDIEYCCSIDSSLANIKADVSQLEQVILNLATNARDAMPNGGKFELRTSNITIAEPIFGKHVHLAPGSYVSFTATDTGSGMDAATCARVFEPFFTTKEQGRGTGLGLSTVYGIVRQCGGDISVESTLGKGTTFKIIFPAICDAQSARTSASMQPVVCGVETILVVDDEEGVRDYMSEVLISQGYRVLAAGGGDDAIRLSRTYHDKIDLLVTDVVMPKMSGEELAGRLKSSHPQMRILYMSGYTNVRMINNGVTGGLMNYIQKPFSPASIAAKVRRVLDAEPSGANKPVTKQESAA